MLGDKTGEGWSMGRKLRGHIVMVPLAVGAFAGPAVPPAAGQSVDIGTARAVGTRAAKAVEENEREDARTAAAATAALPPSSTVTLTCGIFQQINISTGGPVTYQVSGPASLSGPALPITSGIPAGWVMLPAIANGPVPQWVQAQPGSTPQTHAPGLYYYDIKIIVPTCPTPLRVLIDSNQAAAADSMQVRLRRVTGAPWTTTIAQTATLPGAQNPVPVFYAPAVWPSPGTYRLRFRVNKSGSPGPSGLIFSGVITAM
jgi:hypothetical protein